MRDRKSTLRKSAQTEVSRRPAHETLTEVMLSCAEKISSRCGIVDCVIRVHELYSYTAIVEQECLSQFVPNLLHNWGSSQLWVPAWNKMVVVKRTTLSKLKRRARQWKVDMINLEWSSRTCWVVWVMKAAVGSFGPSSSSLHYRP